MDSSVDEFFFIETYIDFYSSIGRLAIAHSKLEQAIDFVISRLLGLTDDKYILIEGKIRSLSTRMELLEETAHVVVHDPVLLGELDEMLIAARAANTFRNRIMHDQWAGAKGTGSAGSTDPIVYDTAFKRRLVRSSKQKTSTQQQSEYSLTEIDSISRRSIALSLHLAYWLQQAGYFPGKKLAGPPPWPYK